MKVNKIVQFIGRLITSIVILGITAFFTPGFSMSSMWILVTAISILTLVDFFLGSFTKLFYHPYIKFFLGFIFACIALYTVQYLIVGYVLSFIPIILGGIIFGLVDYMLPNEDYKEDGKYSKDDKNRK